MPSAPARGRVRSDLIIAVAGAVAMFATFFAVPAESDPPDCDKRVSLEISVSTEKAGLVAQLADDYEKAGRVVGGVCAADVGVHGLTSGKAKSALAAGWKLGNEDLPPAPHVWLPTSSMWLRLLEQETTGGDGGPVAAPLGPVTASTLVIAMPQAVGDALAQAGTRLTTWADVLALARSGWGDHGKPEWGRFVLGRDNPDVSTSGLAATVATYHAAGGDISAAALKNPQVISFVHGIESSVGRYGNEAVDFMTEIFAEEQADHDDDSYRPAVDAVVIQEQMTYAYNCGAPDGNPARMDCDRKPDRPLTVVHPQDGTLLLDHPFVPLARATADQRAVARDFYEYLREDERQQRFRAAGFRDPTRPARPTGELVDVLGLPADQELDFVPPPSGDLIATMLDNWNNVKKKVRVLLVLDVSDSMNDAVNDPDTAKDPSKLDLVKPAAKEAIDLLATDDEIGLWTFSNGPHTEVHPIAGVGAAKEEVKRKIDALSAADNTALYSTTEEAYKAMAAGLDPNRINAVVVLSDGMNTQGYANAPTDGAAQDILLDRLDPAGRDATVRIFTIGYGAESPKGILADIASTTKGVYVDARDPHDVGEAFVAVFQNFG